MPNKKIVIFDFCGTLIQFQTADRYVAFCLRQMPFSRKLQFRKNLIVMLEKLKIFKLYNMLAPNNNWHKRMILKQLQGATKQQCDTWARDYFLQELLPNIVTPAVEKLKMHLVKNERVCILSGGYGIYIKYFAQYFGVKEIYCSEIDFNNGVCTGKMDGMDCMKQNKVTRFSQIQTENSKVIFYTDSPSDIPLLEIVDQPIIFSKNAPQKWATQRNYKQIVWK